VTDKFTTSGFADYILETRGTPNVFLDKIRTFIEWKNIENILKKKYKKRASADGRPAYPPLPMFKLLLLQRWYGLSDPAAEEALKDRISFIRFTGFSLESPLPDYSTICRFRNTLLDTDLYTLLFSEVNRQLEEKHLFVKGVTGAIVDATIIESSRRPRKVMEIMPEDRKEDKTDAMSLISYSDDTDATWIKKGKRPYYGYKAHVSVDAKDGYVIGGHVTPANVADITELEKLITHLPEGSIVLADKGYASEKNRIILRDNKLEDGIMEKAARNRPLTPIQIITNKLISSLRYKVERSIGTLKRGYQFSRMRYIGLKKANMEFLLNSMAFNLKKAAAMVE
jgi:IS5 family transposase